MIRACLDQKKCLEGLTRKLENTKYGGCLCRVFSYAFQRLGLQSRRVTLLIARVRPGEGDSSSFREVGTLFISCTSMSKNTNLVPSSKGLLKES